MKWSLKIGLCGAWLASAAAAQQPNFGTDGAGPRDYAGRVASEVVVIRVSDRPALPGITFGSIIMELWVNERLSYLAHLPYLSDDQFVPAAGAICRINFDYAALQIGVVPLDHGRLTIRVNQMDCNTGRWNIGEE